MGFAVWFTSGAAAFLVARIVPLRRRRGWLPELVAALLTALALGVAATALDFGGWGEPDWRAGAFTFFGAFTAVALWRLTMAGTPPGGSSS